MRIRRNSSFAEFSPEHLIIMHDKALDLGYSSNLPAPNWMTKGLTPNWEIYDLGVPIMSSNKTPNWLTKEVYHRELKLWELDMAELVLPIVEKWAGHNNLTLYESYSTGIRVARKYTLNPTELNVHKFNLAKKIISTMEDEHLTTTRDEVRFAIYTIQAAINTGATFHWTAATEIASPYRLKTLLFKRLDRVSPWWIDP